MPKTLKKVKAVRKCTKALSSLIDPKASESWMFWITLALSAAAYTIPGFQDKANSLTRAILNIDFSTLVGGWMGIYVAPRMVSKAAKAD